MEGSNAEWPEIAARDHESFTVGSGREADPDLRAFWDGAGEIVESIQSQLDWWIEPRQSIAEVGCGAGRLTRCLAVKAAVVVAIDEEPVLELARSRNPALDNVAWRQGLREASAALPERSIDGFLAYSAFRTLPEAEAQAVLGALSRALRPGGWGVLQLFDGRGPRPGPSLITRAVLRTSDALIGRTPNEPPRKPEASGFDLARLDQISEGLGLQRERTLGQRTPFCLTLLSKAG